MAAKWQQWMPLQIDRWRGSPAVKAMHPAARSGYLDLLIAQWQTDDCSISSDPLDLAELSGLGDELWAQFGVRILRNFEEVEGGRLRNQVCFEEWTEAKRVFEIRSASAHRTNTARSPHGHRTVTDGIAPRSADTGTGTVTETVKHIHPTRATHAHCLKLQQELSIPASMGQLAPLMQLIDFEAQIRGDPEKATDWLIEQGRAAKARGETVNVWWFTDKRYEGQKGALGGGNRKARTSGNYEALRNSLEELPEESSDGASGGEAGRDNRGNVEVIRPSPSQVRA